MLKFHNFEILSEKLRVEYRFQFSLIQVCGIIRKTWKGKKTTQWYVNEIEYTQLYPKIVFYVNYGQGDFF